MHSDKETIKKRKKHYLTHLLQYKERQAAIEASFSSSSSHSSSETQRILRKLAHRRGQWAAAKQLTEPWIPTQKMARQLPTSSSAVQNLTRKIELQVSSERSIFV
jgi:hypothetical protein